MYKYICTHKLMNISMHTHNLSIHSLSPTTATRIIIIILVIMVIIYNNNKNISNYNNNIQRN